MGAGQDYLSLIKSTAHDVRHTIPTTFPNVSHRSEPVIFTGGGGGSDMNRVGSIGDILKFAKTPTSTQVFLVYSVPLIIIHTGLSNTPTAFGGIVGGLANGLELVVRQNSIDEVVCNVTNNRGIALCYFEGQLGTGQPSAAGFLDTPRYALGRYVFHTPVVLDGSKGDDIFINIQDDLSALDHLEASVKHSVLPL